MKRTVYIIGLTGGIGVGKSEVASLLSSLGARVIDADKMGHAAYRKGTAGWQRVVEAFGDGIVGADGEVDRGKLGALVFADPKALDTLNRIVHPLARGLVEQQLRSWREEGGQVAVVEAVLLFQAGWDTLVDESWVVTAPQDQVLERLQRTRRLPASDAVARIALTNPPREKAHVIIENGGTTEQLANCVRQLWETRILSRGQITS